MLGDQYNRIFPRRICMKMGFSSRRREMLLFLTSNMAAVTSRANQLSELWQMIIYIVIVSLISKVFCSVFCSCPCLKDTRNLIAIVIRRFEFLLLSTKRVEFLVPFSPALPKHLSLEASSQVFSVTVQSLFPSIPCPVIEVILQISQTFSGFGQC